MFLNSLKIFCFATNVAFAFNRGNIVLETFYVMFLKQYSIVRGFLEDKPISTQTDNMFPTKAIIQTLVLAPATDEKFEKTGN